MYMYICIYVYILEYWATKAFIAENLKSKIYGLDISIPVYRSICVTGVVLLVGWLCFNPDI